jgi:hypothetical protein
MIENENRVKEIKRFKNFTTYFFETWMDSFETWCAGLGNA